MDNYFQKALRQANANDKTISTQRMKQVIINGLSTYKFLYQQIITDQVDFSEKYLQRIIQYIDTIISNAINKENASNKLKSLSFNGEQAPINLKSHNLNKEYILSELSKILQSDSFLSEMIKNANEIFSLKVCEIHSLLIKDCAVIPLIIQDNPKIFTKKEGEVHRVWLEKFDNVNSPINLEITVFTAAMEKLRSKHMHKCDYFSITDASDLSENLFRIHENLSSSIEICKSHTDVNEKVLNIGKFIENLRELFFIGENCCSDDDSDFSVD